MPQAGAIRWRYGFIAGLVLALIALVPQLHLWTVRGRDWRGSYVSFDFDEIAYACYLNTLIDGRPRRNDPYTGRADAGDVPLAESFYSIQFAPAYALALPARALHLSTATVFIMLLPLAALAAALALFWLLRELSEDDGVACACTLVVLCLGALAESFAHGRLMLGLHDIHSTLPFLRRYVPALAFPIFFVFCALVRRALCAQSRRASLFAATCAGLAFAFLVFSYFYLWTAAAAWLACLALLWLIFRPADWRRQLTAFALLGVVALCALIPYALLLARRAQTTDAAEHLAHTHAPALARLPVLLGLAALCALAVAVWRGRVERRAQATLFAASFALLPLLLFNQQVFTGLSLQPIHYARYVANYAALLAVLLTFALVWRADGASARRWRTRLLLALALMACGWSLTETFVRTRRLAPHNVVRDERWHAALALAELTRGADGDAQARAPVILSTDPALADMLPATGGGPLLWAQHMPFFAGTTGAEDRTRLYHQLYFAGMDEQAFIALATNPNSYLRLALFGLERADEAQPDRAPVTAADVQREASAYAAYVARFTHAEAAEPPLAYVVTPAALQTDFTNLDRWYERDTGTRVGDFVLYRVRPRP